LGVMPEKDNPFSIFKLITHWLILENRSRAEITPYISYQ
jgi:hypothetical protein